MIIVSITGPSAEEAARQVRESSRYASLFELRIDLLHGFGVREARRLTRKPLIITCRPVWEGGTFGGDERSRLSILRECVGQGAEYVDLELNLDRNEIRSFIRGYPKTKIILSLHHFEEETPDAGTVYRRFRDIGAHVFKFAFAAHDAWQIRIAVDFLSMAARHRQKAVAIALGEAGEPSRILYRRFGGWATYAAPETGSAAAPGQIRAAQLTNIFHANRLTKSTKIFGVIGDPVRYSKGIYVHNPLFHRYRLNAVYCRFAVTDLGMFMKHMGEFVSGLSVTLPHKTGIVRFMSSLDPAAAAMGAVNTVVRHGSRFRGMNTDGQGALDAIEQKMPVAGKTMLVFGAGGAARAIVSEAVRRGATVLLTNRTMEKARALAKVFNVRAVQPEEVSTVDIIANCTSIGMAPEVEATPIEAGRVSTSVAFDAVYNPIETRFLREASGAGALTVSGLEMYMNQAARQFALYSGRMPSMAVVRKLVAQVDRS